MPASAVMLLVPVSQLIQSLGSLVQMSLQSVFSHTAGEGRRSHLCSPFKACTQVVSSGQYLALAREEQNVFMSLSSARSGSPAVPMGIVVGEEGHWVTAEFWARRARAFEFIVQELAWAPCLDLLDPCLNAHIFSPGVPLVGGTACRVTKEMVLECLSS